MKSIEELREWGRFLHLLPEDRFWELADAIEAEVAERYVELPKDADGVPIRIGDTMEWSDGKTFDVSGIGTQTLFYLDDETGLSEWTVASSKRHHHEPTVEDVMVEFATDWECAEDGEDKTAVLKEYAAKLRLADDGEGRQ